HGGALVDTEIKAVNDLFKKVLIRRNADARGRRDRDQQMLDELDDPAKMGALLTLPSRTAERVVKSGRKGRREALELQWAVALEMASILIGPWRASPSPARTELSCASPKRP